MPNETSKISELTNTSIIPENSLIPISTNKLETSSVDLNTLRSSLWFESAYSDFSTATDNTEKGESFFVYTDTNKESVLGWVNQGGGAYSKLTGLDGQQITFLTIEGVRKVQKSIGFITLEVFGGGVDVEDNSPALQAYFDAAYAGLCGELRLGPGSYKLRSSVTAKCPVTIIGQGKVNTIPAGGSVQNSELVDMRGDNAQGFLLNIISDKTNSKSTIGFYLHNFALVGTRANNNQGLFISAISWQGQLNTLRIDKFGKEGFACAHLNDTMWFDVTILDCGGFVDGVVYYAFDTDTYAPAGKMNQNQFYRLHIEYAKYVAKISAWFCTFNDCHFEVGSNATYSYNEYTAPWIDIKEVNNPITFTGCNFVPPPFSMITGGIVNPTDPLSIIKNHAAAIGCTSPTLASVGPTDTTTNTEVRFTDCSFVVTGGYVLKFVDLPFHNLSMTNCRIRATQSTDCYAINAANQLSLFNNKFFTQTRTDVTGIYANYINNATKPLVRVNGNYVRAAGNVFWHLNAVSLGLTVSVFSFANKSANNLVNYLESNALAGFINISEQLFDKIYWGQSHDFRITEDNATEGFRLTGSTIKHYNATSNLGVTLGVNKRTTAITSSITLVEDAGDNVYRFMPGTNLKGYLGTNVLQWGRSYIGGWAMDTSFTPLTTATQAIGSTTAVVKDVFISNAPTIVSDSNYKPIQEDLDSVLVRAVGSVPYKMYKLLDAIKEKGEDEARWHCGVIAQQVKEALDNHGLNWKNYGFITYDEKTIEVTKGEDGNYYPLEDESGIGLNSEGFIDLVDGAVIITEQGERTFLTKSLYMLRMEEFLVIKIAYLESLMGS